MILQTKSEIIVLNPLRDEDASFQLICYSARATFHVSTSHAELTKAKM
jgi:hypothetical protein